MIDLTHDALPEQKWRPIAKTYDRIPPQIVLEDKQRLREWETDLQRDYFSYVYDRGPISEEVFKKLQSQGEIIKVTIDHRDLTKDKNFWKTEQDIQEKAKSYIS